MSLLTPRPIACREVVEMLTGYLEGALSRRDHRRIEHHLAHCPHCTAYLSQLRETLRLTGSLVSEDLSPEMQREFGEIYRRWQDDR